MPTISVISTKWAEALRPLLAQAVDYRLQSELSEDQPSPGSFRRRQGYGGTSRLGK
jgi:hypothetical protein